MSSRRASKGQGDGGPMGKSMTWAAPSAEALNEDKTGGTVEGMDTRLSVGFGGPRASCFETALLAGLQEKREKEEAQSKEVRLMEEIEKLAGKLRVNMEDRGAMLQRVRKAKMEAGSPNPKQLPRPGSVEPAGPPPPQGGSRGLPRPYSAMD